MHWKELLTLHLVADFLFDRPTLHVDRPQLLEEAEDETPVKEKGWQEALESIYPLKINLLRVEDGDLTYIDADGSPPLRVEHLNLHATNIRNLHSKAHVYPSPVTVTGVILGSGHGSRTGPRELPRGAVPRVPRALRPEGRAADPVPAARRALESRREGRRRLDRGRVRDRARSAVRARPGAGRPRRDDRLHPRGRDLRSGEAAGRDGEEGREKGGRVSDGRRPPREALDHRKRVRARESGKVSPRTGSSSRGRRSRRRTSRTGCAPGRPRSA